MEMPFVLREFLTKIISNKSKLELTDWLESNSATVIVEELRRYIENEH